MKDLKVRYILRTFTQYEARIYERPVIQAVNPNLNRTKNVTFTTK
jgi:hypothetical protein